MRLINLKVSHLFGLKHNVNFDFSENDLIAIVGENGSGKSSIMDSIRLALFGEPSPSRGVKAKDYIRKGAQEGSVTLEFEDINGVRNRVSRILTKGTKDNVNSKIILERYENNKWNAIASTATDVALYVSSILLYGCVKEDLNSNDIVKQAKSAFDISAFISQGNINKILSVTPQERLKLISAALNIQDGDVLKKNAIELKKIANMEMETKKAALESYKSTLGNIPLEEHLKQSLKETEENIVKYSKQGAVYGDAYNFIMDSLQQKTKLNQLNSQKQIQSEALVKLRSQYLISEAYKARTELSENCVRFADRASKILSQKKQISHMEQDIQKLESRLMELKGLQNELSVKLVKYNGYNILIPALNELQSLSTKKSVITDRLNKCKESVLMRQTTYDNLIISESNILKRIDSATLWKYKDEIANIESEINSIKDNIKDRFIELLRSFADNGIIEIDKLDIGNPDKCLSIINKSDFGKLSEQYNSLKYRAKKAYDEMQKIIETNPSIETMEKPLQDETTLLSELSRIKNDLVTTDTLLNKVKSDTRVAEANLEDCIQSIEKYEHTAADARTNFKIANNPSREESESINQERVDTEDLLNKYKTEIDTCYKNINDISGSLATAKNDVSVFNRDKNEILTEIRALSETFRLTLEAAAASAVNAGQTILANMANCAARLKTMTPHDIVRAEDVGKAQSSVQYLENAINDTKNSIADTIAKYSALYKDNQELLTKYRGAIESIDTREILNMKTAAEASVSQLSTNKGRIMQQMEHRRALQDSLSIVENEIDRLTPYSIYVKKLCSLADGNNFTRYINDRTMEVLLDGVNERLEKMDAKWSIYPDNGELYVRDNENMTRPVSGLSGGEATLVSILLLRQISNFNCLWLDESLTMLDENKLQETINLLSGGQDERRSQILVVTHDQDLARSFPEIWQMNGGERVSPSRSENEWISEMSLNSKGSENNQGELYYS